ncbi:MAG: hypothetical protein ACLUTU_03460 [Blautia faecis]
MEQAGQIGEDIVGNLIAGIQKAGTGETLLDVNVTPAGSNASGTASFWNQWSRLLPAQLLQAPATSGNISRLKLRRRKEAELDKVTAGVAEEPAEIAEVQKLINASKAP